MSVALSKEISWPWFWRWAGIVAAALVLAWFCGGLASWIKGVG